ncbi:MAG: hypothetical protein KAS12_04140, partial [Candidatus Aenigmarchaeota archaeon]|nr:hypothetical protein [Candidatus Aenigmarchaeota archaeon]
MASTIQIPNNTIFVTTEITDVTKLPWKEGCRVATTMDTVLLAIQTIDGVIIEQGDRILVKDQIAGEENGIYIASSTGWYRSADSNTSERIISTTVVIREGLINEGLMFALITPNPILDTTPLVFAPLSGGSGLLSLNGLTADPQIFAVGETGSDVNIASVANTHTFNFPDAGENIRGIVSTGAQTMTGKKNISITDVDTSGVSTVLTTEHKTSGVAANGIGVREEHLIQTSAGVSRSAAQTTHVLTDVNDITRTSETNFYVLENGNLVKRASITPAGTTTDTLRLLELSIAGVKTPPAGEKALFIDNADGLLKMMTSAGVEQNVIFGITSLGGLTSITQTLSVGTSGTDINWNSAGIEHRLNVPNASLTNRGVITAGAQDIAGEKTFQIQDATNANTTTVSHFAHNTTGIPGIGIGSAITLDTQTNMAANTPVARISSTLKNISHPVSESDFNIETLYGGAFQSLLYGDINGVHYKSSIVNELTITEAFQPSAGKQTIFIDSLDHRLKTKDSTGGIHDIGVVPGGGITSLGGEVGSVQFFATGTTGTNFNIVSAGNVHTFNIPDASSTTRGFLSTMAQNIGGLKTHIIPTTATATSVPVAKFQLNSTGTPAANFGPNLVLLADSQGVQNRDIFSINAYWVDPTDISRLAYTDLSVGASSGSEVACTLGPGLIKTNQLNTLIGDMFINPIGGNTAVNIDYGETLTHALEINSSSGNCLRLRYNTPSGVPVNYADLVVDAAGKLTISATGGVVFGDIVIDKLTTAEIDSTDRLYLNPTTQNVGVNINSGITMTRALEVNAADGNCLRLIYNDNNGSPANYGDFTVDAAGKLTISASGGVAFGDITTTNITTAEIGSTDRLYLNPTTQNIGVNINSGITMTRALEVNAADGNCLRLINNDPDGSPTNYTDINVDTSGVLTVTPVGSDPYIHVAAGGVRFPLGGTILDRYENNTVNLELSGLFLPPAISKCSYSI